MNKYICMATLALCSSALAQEPNRDLNQPRPGQTPPPRPQPSVTERQQTTATPTPTTPGGRASQALSNLITDWRLEDLPQPVQKTVREQAAGQKIADIDREDRSGRTVWEVEFEKQGRNTEIHVAEDGTLMPEANRQGESPTAAGTQTGRSGIAMALGTQWEDLPRAVQQKAMQYGGKEKVADIDREEWRGKVAYEVEFRREGRNLEIHFGEDGAILESNDPSAATAQGSAPATEAGRAPSIQQPAQPQPLPPAQPSPQAPNQQPPRNNPPTP